MIATRLWHSDAARAPATPSSPGTSVDTIPHDRLMALVAGSISDGRVLSLIESFLHQDIMTEAARWQPTTGTPQGAVLSPLLANRYRHPLDRLMEQDGYRMVRGACPWT